MPTKKVLSMNILRCDVEIHFDLCYLLSVCYEIVVSLIIFDYFY